MRDFCGCLAFGECQTMTDDKRQWAQAENMKFNLNIREDEDSHL